MEPERSDAWAIERSFTDAASFDIIFSRHYDSVYSFVTRAVGSDAGADLAQEVFVVAFDQRRRFRRDRDSARPWLFGIARNLLRRWYRTEARRRRAHRRQAGGNRAVDFTPDAIDRLSAEAMRDELRAALRAIPRRERDVLLLFALGDLSYAEIAEAVAAPVGTVRSRLHRGRERLRRLLGEGAEAILGSEMGD